MSKITNFPKKTDDELINVNRSQIEHRATWMGLTYKCGLEAGADAEAIARKAITETGMYHGSKHKDAVSGSDDMRDFTKVFLSEVAQKTFEQEITVNKEKELTVEFHYCPLLAAWQKQGFDDDTCAKLCDVAMDGDRAIAKAMGYGFELTDTLASGCCVCKMRMFKK